MKRIAIIGGGISGLSAAFLLERKRSAGMPVEYVLFEQSPQCGGVILTENVDECIVEAGPDSFLTEKPWASELCEELGIADQLIGSNDSQRKTYILVNGKLIPMPDGLVFMIPTKILPAGLSRLFSIHTKLRMMREWLHPPLEVKNDESVASFVERHYGNEMVDRLADPLLSGVYGGDVSQLSVKAVLPRFAEMQARYGSLGKATIENRRKAISKDARPIFTSLKNGMQQMVDALLLRIPAYCLRSNTPIQLVRPLDTGWAVSLNDKIEEFDSVIIAVPAHAAAMLLDSSSANLASELRGIQYSSSVTVALGYDRRVRERLPAGFGYLVPRVEGKRVLAVTFVHNKFPHRAPEDRALLRCFLGGTRDEAILELADEEILRIVRKELREVLGIDSDPLFSRVYKWREAMAQYNVGHLERLQRIERLRQAVPGLFFAGNAYYGIGVPDCVRSGNQAASQALGGPSVRSEAGPLALAGSDGFAGGAGGGAYLTFSSAANCVKKK
jgi:protoporphyrinogen/coproporphyrinogen III oxidase